MSAWARPGVKCACVDDGPNAYGDPTSLVKNRIYTIKSMARVDHLGISGVILVEVAARYESFGLGFNIARFRPIITKTIEQDVQMFLSLLVPDEVSA